MSNTTPTTTADPVQSFLKIAPKQALTIEGSIPAGANGGSTSNVSWQAEIPVQASFMTAVEYFVQLPLTLTIPASGSVTVSPFAPYSAVSQQMTIGGSAPWPMLEATAFYLDQVAQSRNYDPLYPGLGNNSGIFGAIIDEGPWTSVVGGAGSISPGQVITNTGASPVTNTYTLNFKFRQQLQRRRHLLWGALPMGDVANRVVNKFQLNPLVGTNPEFNLFVSASTGTTASLASAATVYATYETRYIDLAYPGIPTSGQPTATMGLQIVRESKSGFSAGTVTHQLHSTSMLYTSIHHLAINNEAPLQLDYFGDWDTESENNAREEFNGTTNTFADYFARYHQTYHRYPLKGHYVFDYERGDFPDLTAVTPYVAWRTNTQTYAQIFGIPLTPAMSTAWRFPAGTSLTNAYVTMYNFGLKEVPY